MLAKPLDPSLLLSAREGGRAGLPSNPTTSSRRSARRTTRRLDRDRKTVARLDRGADANQRVNGPAHKRRLLDEDADARGGNSPWTVNSFGRSRANA